MHPSVLTGTLVLVEFKHAHLAHVAPAILAVLIHAAQGDSAARENIEAIHVLTAVARHWQPAVDFALVVEQPDDEVADASRFGVLDESLLLVYRGVLEARHSERDLRGDATAALGLREILEVSQRTLQLEPHDVLVPNRIQRIDTHVQVV